MKYIKIKYFDNDFFSPFIDIARLIHDYHLFSYSDDVENYIDNLNEEDLKTFLEALKELIIEMAYNDYKLNKIFYNLKIKNYDFEIEEINIHELLKKIEISIEKEKPMESDNAESIYIPLNFYVKPYSV